MPTKTSTRRTIPVPPDDDQLGRLIDAARRDPATDIRVRRWLAKLSPAGGRKKTRRKAR